MEKKISIEDELYIYRTILDQIPDRAVLVIDAEENVLLYNQLSAQYDDLTKSEVEGKPIQNIMYGQTESGLADVLKTGIPKYNYTNSYRLSNSKVLKLYGSSVPIKKDGKVIAACSFCRRQEDIEAHLNEVCELQKRIEDNRRKLSNGTKYTFGSIIGDSKAIRMAIEKCRKITKLKSPVFLYGETGTGKELFAQGIHNASARVNQPFIAVNCAAIPSGLMESVLFGTVKGAYTGSESREGLFEQAGEGTLFLDEINSMPLELQGKILRVIQEKTLRRVGGKSEIPVKARIISASNKSPAEILRDGSMRTDLYYRIATVSVDIPPLREREEDIILLAEHYRMHYEAEIGTGTHPYGQEVKDAFRSYSWPGNVRELQSVIENLLIMADDNEELTLKDLPPQIRRIYEEKGVMEEEVYTEKEECEESDLESMLLQMEKNYLTEVLIKNRWNISESAKQVGYTRSKLQFRMKKLNIEKA